MNIHLLYPNTDPGFETQIAALRAIGLLRLLSSAYISEELRFGPPSRDEADGIVALAEQTGTDLARLLKMDFAEPSSPLEKPRKGASR